MPPESRRVKYKVLNQLNVRDKRVFLRIDFNVPIANRRILDDSKIKAHYTTINYLMGKGARIVLGTHIGRPDVHEVSLKKDTGYKGLDTNTQIIFRSLKRIYGNKISFINSCIGEDVKTCIRNLRKGRILLLQNLRYERGERSNNESEKLEFARGLSSYFDIYVNDALSVCQNEDTSVFYLPRFVKKTAIGLLLKKEKNLMEKLIKPILPAAAFLGGFKVQDKIGALQKLLRNGFEIFLGGAMRNPFLRFQNYKIGGSILDSDYDDVLHHIMEDFKDKIHIPVDVKVGRMIDKKEKRFGNLRYVDFLKDEEIHAKEEALDNGPKTMLLYKERLKQKKVQTMFANGPYGLIENRSFRFGTYQLARIFLEHQRTFRVYGGGELNHGFNLFSKQFKIDASRLGECCYAGNGMLQYIAREGDLPGLSALSYDIAKN